MIRRKEFDDLRRAVASSTVRGGVGYKLRRTAGGTVLDIQAGKGGGSGSHPFKIFIEPKPVSGAQDPGDAGYHGYVTEGSLFKSLRPDDYTAITGLTMPNDEEPAYFEVLPNDAIYLESAYDAQGEVTSTEIVTWGEGGTFDPTLEAWETGAFVEGEEGGYEPGGVLQPYQTFSRLILGYTLANETGSPVLTQEVKSNLLLRECIIDARPARYPLAHVGTYHLASEDTGV